jgi:hypothetical protein
MGPHTRIFSRGNLQRSAAFTAILSGSPIATAEALIFQTPRTVKYKSAASLRARYGYGDETRKACLEKQTLQRIILGHEAYRKGIVDMNNEKPSAPVATGLNGREVLWR